MGGSVGAGVLDEDCFRWDGFGFVDVVVGWAVGCVGGSLSWVGKATVSH